MMQLSAWFDVFSSLWLVCDMVLDFVTTEGYYLANEYAFLWASVAALLLPTAILSLALLIVSIGVGWDKMGCNVCTLCVFSPAIIALYPLIALLVALLWFVSPCLHFIQSIFVLFGITPRGLPRGETEMSEIQVILPITIDLSNQFYSGTLAGKVLASCADPEAV